MPQPTRKKSNKAQAAPDVRLATRATVCGLYRVRAELAALLAGNAVDNRLLSEAEGLAAAGVELAIARAIDRLQAEPKPDRARFPAGQPVRVTPAGPCGTRTPTPAAGSKGVVRDVRCNAHGWWLVVEMGGFFDADRQWWAGGRTCPVTILFKPDELTPYGRPAKKKKAKA